MSTILLCGFLLAGCAASPKQESPTAAFFRGPLPTGWIATSSTDADRFKPLRGLTNSIAQITLTKPSATLHWDIAPGKTKVFHPEVILLVFSAKELETIESAVRKESNRSDYPPIIFGATPEHIFVTSPGYVNEGLHTPDAEAIIEELKQSLKRTMEIR